MDPVRTERTATRRLFARVLLVLGGAAAVWALGTATAAADTGADLARDLGAAVEAASVPGPALLAGGGDADIVERALDVLPVDDGAKAAVDRFDEVGTSVAEHFRHAAPGQPVNDLLPSLPDLAPLPDPGATDGPLAVAPESGRPVAVPAAERQRHGEPGDAGVTGVDVDPTPRSGSPASSVETPDHPLGDGSPLAPPTLPAPAHTGHTGAGGADVPQAGLLSTAPVAGEPALAHTPRAARADEPAAVDAQPGVTPD